MKPKPKSKTDYLTIRITPDKKAYLEIRAQIMKMTFTDLLITGATMYADFDPDFLKQMKEIAEKVKLDMPTVIQQLLLVYAAQDAAILKTFGVSKTYQRAFQFNEHGLITGNQLSDAVFAEVKEAALALRERLEGNRGAGAPLKISKDTAALLAARE